MLEVYNTVNEFLKFLMHRVELKVTLIKVSVRLTTYSVPNAPCGVESSSNWVGAIAAKLGS